MCESFLVWHINVLVWLSAVSRFPNFPACARLLTHSRGLPQSMAPTNPTAPQAFTASSSQQLQQAAEGLKEGLEQACHEAHLRYEAQAVEVAARLAELERKQRGLEAYAHESDTRQQVASLAARVGSAEDSLSHLAQVREWRVGRQRKK